MGRKHAKQSTRLKQLNVETMNKLADYISTLKKHKLSHTDCFIAGLILGGLDQNRDLHKVSI